VLATGARLAERARSALLDMADSSVAEASRRRGRTTAALRKLREAALDRLPELLYRQPDETAPQRYVPAP